MGKIAYFSIIFQKQNPIFYSGETVIGCVNIRISERLKYNSVSMILSGKAKVHWSEHKTVSRTHADGKTHTHTENIHFRAEEQYLNKNVPFLLKQNSDTYLEAGDHSYPFQILLPPNIPTSFEHENGQIRYSISATIDIPWAFDKHTVRSFTVLSVSDLNLLDPILKQSYGVSGSKVFCCWCCASEPVMAKFDVLKCGFVCGEPIVFNASIENKSNRVLHQMSVKLVQHLKFHANGKSKSCSRKVAEVNHHSSAIRPHSVEYWDRGCLVIPAVCTSSNGTCNIIQISYSVVFSFGASISVDSDLTVPIRIGTIPLRNSENTISPFSIPLLEPSAPLAPILTHDACIFGANPNKELGTNFEKGDVVESDSNEFTPLYPVYKDYSI